MRIIHGSVQQEIITLINEATKVLVLVSPYLKPWQRLTAAIERGDCSQRKRLSARDPGLKRQHDL